ncbi:MAG: enoyl-[acyl-carrier-protein] reductase FabL [Chloroflexota bacterium]|nr:enoyl-[acyl-carrier-protein] reductase FabL [Chloroflexota bacterium]MDE2969976.1 enoyl-[acyl-carrier-protein] reductase FabL [Chloroflexota bacterium]
MTTTDGGKPFAGRVALVTGASRGIGRAIARELATLGADIVVNYFRNHAEARAAQQEIEALGVQCLRVAAHLAEPEQVRKLFDGVRDRFGRLDILVNNAASGVNRPGLELEEKHWDWTLNINSKAPWLCTKEAVPLMKEGGRVVNISSLGAGRVFPNYTSVGVSKAALEALTRYMAVELAPLGISVNAVSGGYVQTDALEHFPNREEMLATARSKTPGGELLTAEDLAKAVAFLCSDAAAMIRGQVIVVDGGMSLAL